MKKARQIIAEQPGDPKPNSLDHFESSGSQYIISYMTDPGHVKYTVRINRDNHDIMEVVPTQ